ncbi:putative periplasmic esterase, partial [Salmonella enterica subsp. enterica serovar Heidelberg str. RI-11-014316]
HMAIVILGNRPHSPVANPKVNPNCFCQWIITCGDVWLDC